MTRLLEFRLPTPTDVPNSSLYPLHLEPTSPSNLDGVEPCDGGVRFLVRGWFEVLMTVGWDPDNDDGHRFAHTSIPDRHPLHSEAIEARVLNPISNGEQVLRGNSVFDPDGEDRIRLEVWQNSGAGVAVRQAGLVIRRLD